MDIEQAIATSGARLRLANKARSRRKGRITRRQPTMFKHDKVRQAGIIVVITTLLLILPNLSRLFG